MLAKALSLAVMICAPSILSADMPWRGTLIGQTDGDILQYSCTSVDDGVMNCDFIQILLSNKATEEEWPEELEGLQNEFNDPNIDHGLLCSQAEPLLRFMADGMPYDTSAYQNDELNGEDLNEFAERVRNDREHTFASFDAIRRFCEDGEFEDLVTFIRLGHERDMNTCEPYINEYSLRFVQSTEDQWVVSEPPMGACGLINTSRFIRNQSPYDSIWRHVAAKVITNPEATILDSGSACGLLDESITNYDWSGSVRVNCEFIE